MNVLKKIKTSQYVLQQYNIVLYFLPQDKTYFKS